MDELAVSCPPSTAIDPPFNTDKEPRKDFSRWMYLSVVEMFLCRRISVNSRALLHLFAGDFEPRFQGIYSHFRTEEDFSCQLSSPRSFRFNSLPKS